MADTSSSFWFARLGPWIVPLNTSGWLAVTGLAGVIITATLVSIVLAVVMRDERWFALMAVASLIAVIVFVVLARRHTDPIKRFTDYRREGRI